jgi:hypothetical protein
MGLAQTVILVPNPNMRMPPCVLSSLTSISSIAGTAMRTFPKDPTVYATFEALVSKKAR